MRGNLTEQNLTDYALNELQPEDRFYVESMLACSEECREDVYSTLELSELLKAGFDEDESTLPMELNEEQRTKVLEVPHWDVRSIFQKAAAVALLASGVAFLSTRPAVWQRGGAVESIATAGQAVQGFVVQVQEKGFATTADEFAARLEQNSSWQANTDWQLSAQPAVCTPTSWGELPSLSDAVDM